MAAERLAILVPKGGLVDALAQHPERCLAPVPGIPLVADTGCQSPGQPQTLIDLMQQQCPASELTAPPSLRTTAGLLVGRVEVRLEGIAAVCVEGFLARGRRTSFTEHSVIAGPALWIAGIVLQTMHLNQEGRRPFYPRMIHARVFCH
jgi:hypothetical protein